MTDFQSLINISIKKLRLETGLSQEKFSEKCDISSDNYRNIENNRHTPKAITINKICDTFNISPIELLSLTLKPISQSKIERVMEQLKELDENQVDLVIGFIKLIKNHK